MVYVCKDCKFCKLVNEIKGLCFGKKEVPAYRSASACPKHCFKPKKKHPIYRSKVKN